MVNVSTKYKVVIVNVMVIGLLLCGQYWIDQQNEVDLKSIESTKHQYEVEKNSEEKFPKSFDMEDLERMVESIKNDESEQNIFEFEDVDEDHFFFEFDPKVKEFTCYINGGAKAVNVNFKFNADFFPEIKGCSPPIVGGKHNVEISGREPNQQVLYTKPIKTKEDEVYKWLENHEDYSSIKFKSVDDLTVTISSKAGKFEVRAENEKSKTRETRKTTYYFDAKWSPTIKVGNYLNDKYSIEIKSTFRIDKNGNNLFKESNIRTKPERTVFTNKAQNKIQETLKQKIQKRKMYRTFMWVSIVTLVFFVIIFVIFYDEEAKTFVFVIVKNENEFEDTEVVQYTPDGANNA